MATILDTIISTKLTEVEKLYKYGFKELGKRSSAFRGFENALRANAGVAIIAEVKKASPSKGVLRADFDPVAIAQGYQRGGACAVSVLTDQTYFQGSIAYLQAVRSGIELPVLRKDFIIDPIQIEQSVAMGADAVLLIVAALSDQSLHQLYAAATSAGLDVLIEVHDKQELQRALELKPGMLGINNRNLKTFDVNIQTTFDLLPLIDSETIVVSESGIGCAQDMRQLAQHGVKAALIGERFVVEKEPELKLRELVDAGSH